ncbi:MAG: DUF1800 domain-containing protein [Kiritimatiellae bacterium]|nr:DUF1800 domain-containing protein [Kiritimatiellia bacterium]
MTLQKQSANAWNRELAAHLLNRAGFGSPPADIDRFTDAGLHQAVEFLLQGEDPDAVPIPGWADKRAFEQERKLRIGIGKMDEGEKQQAVRQVFQRQERMRLLDLRAWWLHRMRYTATPLQEKMTLFYHGHFATGFQKVRSAYAMFLQNQTFRAHALGNWKDLVHAIARDPAMLIYLDGIQNTRTSPNENFAREVLELFTLGEGHYSEQDITEAARAFTGWRLNRRTFTLDYVERRHDPGRKEFMGHKGNFDGDEILDLVFKQDQSAAWLARKLWTFFAYPNPEPAVVDGLADILRDSRYELKPALKAIFLSRAFYAERAYRTQVKSPVQWLIGTLRYLEAPLPDPGMTQRLLTALGQDLFEPPNVKGWDGGITWITTASLAQRYEAAANFAHGRVGQRGRMQLEKRREQLLVDAGKAGIDITLPDFETPWQQSPQPPFLAWNTLVPEKDRTSRGEILNTLQQRLYPTGLREKDRTQFEQFFLTLPPARTWREDTFAKALEALLNTPQYQMT